MGYFGAMIHLFSYGTLQQPKVQMASFGRLLKGVPDTLPGWKKEMVEITDAEVFAQSGERFHPILVAGEASDEVPGMVFEITPEDLAAADRYEVEDYKRVAVTLKSGLEAFAFVKV
jgi:hypothetical protein